MAAPYREIRYPAVVQFYDDYLNFRHADRHSSGNGRCDLFERIRDAKIARFSKADFGSAGRNSHYRLWLFRPDIHDAPAAFHLWERCG